VAQNVGASGAQKEEDDHEKGESGGDSNETNENGGKIPVIG